ncbi:MAG: hypothetical protein C0505_05635 [Leptothrix sp. (in: Bacteria)]|nr:hypothetical protein [Leptothrix sp. (in: b-proteobacteria)]
MQALKSLFTRAQVKAADVTPASTPVELSPESLKLVGGGLPRVSGALDGAVASDAGTDSESLPRVS